MTKPHEGGFFNEQKKSTVWGTVDEIGTRFLAIKLLYIEFLEFGIKKRSMLAH